MGLILALLGWVAWGLQGTFKGDVAVGFISGFYGGLLAAWAAGGAVLIAWFQLKSLADTADSDSQRDGARFALALKDDFFTDRTRILMELIDEDWLLYQNADKNGTPLAQPYFEIDEGRINASSLPAHLKSRLAERRAYSCFEIDDLVLAQFEDLHSLWSRRLLDLAWIYDGFSWYIDRTASNTAIQRYIADQEKDEKDIWAGFLALHHALKNYCP